MEVRACSTPSKELASCQSVSSFTDHVAMAAARAHYRDRNSDLSDDLREPSVGEKRRSDAEDRQVRTPHTSCPQ